MLYALFRSRAIDVANLFIIAENLTMLISQAGNVEKG